MSTRHDEWGQVPESQRKAAARYQREHTTLLTIRLNSRTDADILQYLWTVRNKSGLIKRLLRDEMTRTEHTAMTMDRVREAMQAHRNCCEDWEHGDVSEIWADPDHKGVTCVRYDDGSLWHYAYDGDQPTWW